MQQEESIGIIRRRSSSLAVAGGASLDLVQLQHLLRLTLPDYDLKSPLLSLTFYLFSTFPGQFPSKKSLFDMILSIAVYRFLEITLIT